MQGRTLRGQNFYRPRSKGDNVLFQRPSVCQFGCASVCALTAWQRCSKELQEVCAQLRHIRVQNPTHSERCPHMHLGAAPAQLPDKHGQQGSDILSGHQRMPPNFALFFQWSPLQTLDTVKILGCSQENLVRGARLEQGQLAVKSHRISREADFKKSL